jgi:hypothetical protein
VPEWRDTADLRESTRTSRQKFTIVGLICHSCCSDLCRAMKD